MRVETTPEPGADVRFAIVEDGREYRRHIARLIAAKPGWRTVIECASAEEALAGLQAARPEIVLLDICLGERCGVAIVSQLKRLLPQAAIVMLTVVEDPEIIVRALESGASGYIVKAGEGELMQAIEEIVEGGAGMSPAVARRLVMWFQRRGSSTRPRAGKLTARQWEILKLAARGKQQGEIALALGISAHTVKNHFRNIYETLDVDSVMEAVIRIRGGSGLLDG
ncbi:MAG: response regulator transcription factor [Verrucomicrobiales bacterium]|nr:response regulator transcription factor [Verrucomicrobiales bacterium]MCP5527319.1 response regulator transcription factor [Verrucomicrobiales bacterium]